MKRNLMKVLAIMCVGVILFGLAGCGGKGKKEEPTIVGKWAHESMDSVYYTFNEDGTGAYFFLGGDMKFTYTDDGEAVTIQYPNSTAPNVFKYTIEGKKLLIEDSFGEIVTYVKK